MTQKSRVVEVTIQIKGRLYQANVFLNQPTAIIIPDRGIVAITALSPKPDISTYKNRYKKVLFPNEKQEISIDQNTRRKISRTIYDETGRLNKLSLTTYSLGKPFTINRRHCVLATPVIDSSN